MTKTKNLPETNNPKTHEYAPDEVNEYGEYIKIGGSPVPGLTLRQILRRHVGAVTRIAWSPAGNLLCSCPWSDPDKRGILVWNVRHREGHSESIWTSIRRKCMVSQLYIRRP